MVWTGTDLTQYDNFLKEWYMSKWIDLLNNLTTTYKLSRKRQVSFKGRQMIIALRTQRTGAIGALQVSGYTGASSTGARDLMAPGFQGVDNAFIKPKIVMGAIGIPQDVIDQSASDRGAFYEVVDFEMMGLKTDMANYLDKNMYCGGTYLSDIATAPATPDGTFTVDNPYRFYVGQILDFWDGTGTGAALTGTNSAGRTVANVDFGTRTITMDATVASLTADDHPYTAGARDANFAFEPLGYEEIIKSIGSGSTDTAGNLLLKTYKNEQKLYGVDRDTAGTPVPEWGSTVTDLSGADLEFSDLHQLMDDIHDSSGGDPTVFLTTRTTRRHIASRMAYPAALGTNNAGATQRFMNTTKLKGGFVGAREDLHGQGGSDWVLFDDRIPIVVDRYATHDYATSRGTLFAIDSRHCFWALVTDWRWWAPEGRILREATSSTGPQFGVLAHAYLFGEHVVDAPNTCGRLHNFAVSGA